ncbi:hypothetical protein A2482_04665 [Candidatus Falkowbacteria bacterium RIFOXYC2_FULL_48_21]|uniref:Cupin type-2 domain-containing protein n=1 Tax=Candidatus Falkowbacteria bacterium RIFOXYC2_FULL_48_21 TaxID=1798005 RepID=A0A1F5T5G0_9BACT|nr:MAG: hypothetical protein A2482_04665 [Candidatus Falkowbacteria bacterium RIFOXYC2_FULL_48_21]
MRRGLWHRIVIHNVNPSDELVNEILRQDLGRGVQVKKWRLEKTVSYEAAVRGGGMLPQKESVIVVDYEKRQPRRRQPVVKHLLDVAGVVDVCGRIFNVTTKEQFPEANVVFWKAVVPSREHYHRKTAEFYIFVGGTGRVVLNGKERRILIGTVVLIPPMVKHYVVPDEFSTVEAWGVAVPSWDANDQFLTK